MTCAELSEFLMAYLDGELSAPERACFEEHLSECPDCVAYLQTYRQAIQMGQDACAEEALLPKAPEELVRAVLEARKRRK